MDVSFVSCCINGASRIGRRGHTTVQMSGPKFLKNLLCGAGGGRKHKLKFGSRSFCFRCYSNLAFSPSRTSSDKRTPCGCRHIAVVSILKNLEDMSDSVAFSKKLVDEARNEAGPSASASQIWAVMQQKLTPSTPFEIHQHCYQTVYEGIGDIKPAWIPSSEVIESTNIHQMMTKRGFKTYQEFYDWSIGKESRDDFWMESMKNLQIEWSKQPTAAFDFSKGGPAHASYFPGGKLNITDSCFNKREEQDPALVYSMESDPRSLQTMSFGVLDRLSNQIANALTTKLNLSSGDAVAVCMPMTPESIAIYLGIVKAGCVVISIADSFSAEEIATRCRLGNAKVIFTQDVIFRGAKFLPLFGRVLEADSLVVEEKMATETFDDSKETKSDSETSDSMKIVVLPGLLHAGHYPERPSDNGSTWGDTDKNGDPVSLHETVLAAMRVDHDASWYDLLHMCSEHFQSVQKDSMDACNILFSSGTTGEPKAIIWSHSTPIKSAVDGYYHQDIHVGDRVAWPTSLGWMMGPWLLFQLMNGATIGLFNGISSTEGFCQFVEEAEISMVGVVPSLVKAWQARNSTQSCDWSKVRKFSSTGEASDPITYHWLMSRVPGYAPVVEYCGGTEIGGSFLSSTLVQPNVPSMFSTPVLGSQIMAINHDGDVHEESNFCTGVDGRSSGELVILPPSVGLSTKLLNRDHYDTYYKEMPSGPNGEVLRRHGDEIEYMRSSLHLTEEERGESTPYFRALGRCDDTMNIGGIKVGSVEIERVCNLVPEIKETAAIAVTGPHGGPANLVVYVILNNGIDSDAVDKSDLKAAMKHSVKIHLNPLFGISDIVLAESLPRTASNKVMRRLLRDEYTKAED